MSTNFIYFILFYFLIIFSTFGYGLLFNNIFKLEKYKLNYGFIGLIGIFFLIIYSYISHYFIAHGIIHNFILIFCGIFLFFYFFKKKKINIELKLFILIFSFLFLGFLLFKTHDDFPYYHFPYTYHLTQNSLMVGIGILNHGFRTPSSMFYLNSLFYLPIVKYYLFHMGAILFMGFSSLSLILSINKNLLSKKIDYIFFLRLLSLVFIFVFFYRIQEHGTDRSAMILILLLFTEFLDLRNNYQKFDEKIIKILFILGLIISLKAFYILYFIFLIPFIIYLYLDNKIYLFLKIFKNKFFYLLILIFLLVVFNYFFNTGCFIYPVSQTCLFNLDWSIPLEGINRMDLHYENWAKAGKRPGFIVSNPEEYVQGFNWVSTWMDHYFFNKVSDFIGGLTLLLIIFLITFYSKYKTKIKNKSILLFYATLMILFFEWFYNHPALRYGGYSVIALSFFIPFSFILSKFKNIKNFNNKVYFVICLAVIIFTGRNIDRIANEHEFYKYQALKNPYHRVYKKRFFRMEKKFNEYIAEFENCKVKANCFPNNNKEVKYKFNGVYVIGYK